MIKKLKKKVWGISTVILLVYITTLILNPTAWTALLPIIIPSGLLTVGIPVYAITKNMKNSLEKTENSSTTIIEEQPINNEKEKAAEKEVVNAQTKINQSYINLESQYEPTKQEKNKIKSKGTMV